MKNIILIILLGISFDYFAQFSSYSESEENVLFTCNMLFSARSNSEVSQKYLLSAKKDCELTEQMGPFKNIVPVLEEAFELADCNACAQISEYLTDNPIRYIFSLIECHDVFLVTEYKNQYKVIRYQPEE